MSAIFGLVTLNDQPETKENLERMSAALARRGSDGGGIWTQECVGLGQRLMRFTPEDRLERQPLVSADGLCVLVSDARVDNRAELLRDLRLEVGDWGNLNLESFDYARDKSPIPNLQFPDSELILHAYEKWGEACVGHLIGVFAFAIWDARTQRLFAARSPIVAPALCYYATPQVFAFATMPKGLFASLAARRGLCRRVRRTARARGARSSPQRHAGRRDAERRARFVVGRGDCRAPAQTAG